MKVVTDDELSELHKHSQAIAKNLANGSAEQIIAYMEQIFANDKKIGDLGYSGLMTFINTVGSFLFMRMFIYSCKLGKKFPDAEHTTRDLFEEVHHGLRLYLNMPAINHKEYVDGIKKISGDPFKNIKTFKENHKEE